MQTVGRRKITHGYVIQTYNDQGECLEQEFVAGDVEWETHDGEPCDPIENHEYQKFHMIQPNVGGLVSTILNRLRDAEKFTREIAQVYGVIGESLETNKIHLQYVCPDCDEKSEQWLNNLVENGTHTCDCGADMQLDENVRISLDNSRT